MPFNLSQIFGGWRRKEKVGRKATPRAGDENFSLPARGGARRVALTKMSGDKEFSEPTRGRAKGHSELAWRLIVSPHISEKAKALGEGGYVFKVADDADKHVLKRAVEDRYGVDVVSVNTIPARSKTRRRGQTLGERRGFKKAVVTLKAGQAINEF